MSAKECSHHKGKRKKLIRRCCAGFLIISFIILFIILLVWAILQPKKPRFVLQDATVFAFNVTAPNLLSSNFQVTLTSRNPNNRIGIYYDRLHVYATYQNQQITYNTAIPPTYQGHKEINVWSPFIYGTNVPVAPYNGMALSQDQADGNINLLIKIDGRVRFKVGTFVTGSYHLYVKCQAPISFGSRSTGIVIGDAIKYQFVESCSVNV